MVSAQAQSNEQIEVISDVKNELIVSPLKQNTLQSEMGQEFPVLYFRRRMLGLLFGVVRFVLGVTGAINTWSAGSWV